MMNGSELNAPAVSLATIVTGAAAFLSYLPPVFGGVSVILGSFIGFYALKNQREKYKNEKLDHKRKELEITILEKQIEDASKGK